MLEFNTKNYHFMTFDPFRLDHLKAKMYLETDPDIRRFLGDSIGEFLEASKDTYYINDSAFLVARNDKIIGYLALIDYDKFVEMHYALLQSARGFKFSKEESTGVSLIREAGDDIFTRSKAVDFLKLYIAEENIKSIRAAENAGFVLYNEVPDNNLEYRKYRGGI